MTLNPADQPTPQRHDRVKEWRVTGTAMIEQYDGKRWRQVAVGVGADNAKRIVHLCNTATIAKKKETQQP